MDTFWGFVGAVVVASVSGFFQYRGNENQKIMKNILEEKDNNLNTRLTNLNNEVKRSVADEFNEKWTELTDKQIDANKEIQEMKAAAQRSIEKARGELEMMINQKQIDANLRASARIDWIQKVRLVETEFIDNCNNFSMHSMSIALTGYDYTKDPFNESKSSMYQDLINKYIEKATADFTGAKKNAVLLKLYFGTGDEDKNIISLSEEIVGNIEIMYKENDQIERIVKSEELAINGHVKKIENMYATQNNKIENFVLAARDYNKIEWDRAKIGE